MKAEIKRFWIRDDSYRNFYPEDPEYFFAWVEMDIGPADVEGGHIFNLMVCTPRWFEENIMTKRHSHPTHETVRENVFGMHYLFVHEFDEEEIQNEVRSLVDRVNGKDWSEIAPRLSRFFAWEFEEYDQGDGSTKSL